MCEVPNRAWTEETLTSDGCRSHELLNFFSKKRHQCSLTFNLTCPMLTASASETRSVGGLPVPPRCRCSPF